MINIEQVQEQIAAKRVELQSTKNNTRYEELLTELNTLLIFKGRLT